MGFLLMAVGVVLDFIALGCAIICLIHAFQNAVWKGFACLICFIYGLYYLFVEFGHEHKGLIMLGLFGAGIGGQILISVGLAMAAAAQLP